MVIYKEVKEREGIVGMQELERLVWDMEPIPEHQTWTAVKNGGILVGAYDGDDMIGFCYGFAGFDQGKAYLCSHMMGIHPDYRSQGIGERLKWLQRDIAIDKGYDLIRWTFDPLQTRNAYLNLTKLNGVSYTYFVNCYGEMQDGLNKGLPSDRFEVSWHITSPHVEKFSTKEMTETQSLGTYCRDRLSLHLPASWDADCYTLPMPADIQTIKENDPRLALDWRLQTREAFMTAFREGYAVVGLQKSGGHYEYIIQPNPFGTVKKGVHSNEN